MAANRKLHAVKDQLFDAETGELVEHQCMGCLERDDEIRGLKRNLANEHRRYGKLKRDKDAEARESEFWALAEALFLEWRIATGHMKSRWTVERFWMCQPYLEREGYAACRWAVWGVAANPNRKQITPDYFEVYDQWELVFDRNQGTFERYANRGAAIFGRHFPIPAALEVPEWLNVPIYARERIRMGIYPAGNEGQTGDNAPVAG